jgi:hypothetical protein
LICFIEEQTEISEHDPQLLPSIAVFELAKQITAHMVHNRLVNVVYANTRVAVPANVHGRVGAMLLLLLLLRFLFVATRRKLAVLMLTRKVSLIVILILNA